MIDVYPLRDAVAVMVEDTRRIVQREDLIPLAELEALKKKADEPCNRNGDEPCECGAKPGKAKDN